MATKRPCVGPVSESTAGSTQSQHDSTQSRPNDPTSSQSFMVAGAGPDILGKPYKMPQFSGDDHDWNSWYFKLRTELISKQFLTKEELAFLEVTNEAISICNLSQEKVAKGSALYQLLVRTCLGKAEKLMMTVEFQNGFEALRKLNRRYSQADPDSSLHQMDAIINFRFRGVDHLQDDLADLDLLVKDYERIAAEEFPDLVMKSILTSRVPEPLLGYLSLYATASTPLRQIRTQIDEFERKHIKKPGSLHESTAHDATFAASHEPQPMDISVLSYAKGKGKFGKALKGKGKVWMPAEQGVSSGRCCFNCGADDHVMKDCPLALSTVPGECRFCGAKGHVELQCNEWWSAAAAARARRRKIQGQPPDKEVQQIEYLQQQAVTTPIPEDDQKGRLPEELEIGDLHYENDREIFLLSFEQAEELDSEPCYKRGLLEDEIFDLELELTHCKLGNADLENDVGKHEIQLFSQLI
eukprot:TRINITY_DN48935_c0_g1_i1.p2 TRINITY_DN48935_c0_g1~~TRINITY_DN48935_c0_g1_i1.p2  ORF type:complete len:469 (+),score=88.45 TRINITY_DN48935_c0_g1_i1:2668-4074(+)